MPEDAVPAEVPTTAVDDPHTALNAFMGHITFAARFAMGQGVDRETIADTLRHLAAGIETPWTVAESMGPITLDEI